MQIMVPVGKNDVSATLSYMHGYMRSANAVRPDSTYVNISKARMDLYMALGIYDALCQLGLIPDGDTAREDLIRIEAKIGDIYDQKRRKDLPRWRADV